MLSENFEAEVRGFPVVERTVFEGLSPAVDKAPQCERSAGDRAGQAGQADGAGPSRPLEHSFQPKVHQIGLKGCLTFG